MALIDFTQCPTDAYGVAPKFEDGALTLGRMSVMALDAALPGDEAGAKDRFARGGLAYRIAEAENGKQPIELPSEDVTLLKDRISKWFTAGSLVRSAWLLLDPASKG